MKRKDGSGDGDVAVCMYVLGCMYVCIYVANIYVCMHACMQYLLFCKCMYVSICILKKHIYCLLTNLPKSPPCLSANRWNSTRHCSKGHGL